jgi:hypothetical protein
MWEELWGGGEVLVLDPQAISTARHEVDVLNAAIAERDEELQRLQAAQAALAERTPRLAGDALNQALIESNHIASQLQVVIRELDPLAERLEAAKQRLELSMTTKVPLPDDLTPEEHAQLIKEALAEAAEVQAEIDGPLADCLPVADLAELFGTEPQTTNLWYRQGFPKQRPAP